MSQASSLHPFPSEVGHGVCHVHPTVPPATSVTFQPGREGNLYLGTSVSLVCSVTVDRTLVDTGIRLTYAYENLPNSRTSTSSGVLNESSFQGMVEFSVLLPSDRGVAYGCVSTVEPVDTPFVQPVTNPRVNLTLELTGKLTSYLQ